MSKQNSKKGTSPHQPYTRFFENTFSRLDIARDVTEQLLPENISKKIDSKSIKLRKDSFVEPNLTRLHSDIIYECNFRKSKQKIWLTLLFDHKSEPDNFVYIQLSKYMNSIWDQQRSDKQFPKVILPIIFYHGSKKWKVKKFEEMFHKEIDEDLLEFLPSFKFVLIDISKYSDEKIRSLKKGFLINTLLAFKHYKDEDYIRENFSFFLETYPDVKDLNFIEAILVFILKITEIRKEEVPILIENSFKKSNSDVMSTYDQIVQTGRKNKEIEMILNLNKEGISIDIISKVANASKDYVKKVINGEITIEPDIFGRDNE